MIEYVLDSKNHLSSDSSQIQVRLNKILYYAEFLKQPLTLGMFVPCDLESNVLEEPNSNDDYYKDANGISENYFIDFKEYQKAKERVLFKGFKVDDQYIYYKDKRNNIKVFLIVNSTIESLQDLEPELTQSAINQLKFS